MALSPLKHIPIKPCPHESRGVFTDTFSDKSCAA